MQRPEASRTMPLGAAALADAAPRNWPLLLLVALVPLQNIYLGHIPSLGPGLNFLNVAVLLSFLVWKLNPRLARSTRTPLHGPVLGYSVMLVLSCFYGVLTLGHMGERHVSSLKDLLIPVLLYFVVLGSVRDRRGAIWVVGATLLPLPYMFRTFRFQLQSVFKWHYDDDLRLVSGTFQELGSNEIAAFYSAYTLVLIALIYYVKNPIIRAVLGVLVVLNGYCLMYSYSRGSWVAFLFGAAVMLWCFKRKLALAAVAAVLITWGALFSHLPVSVQERFSSMENEQVVMEDHSAMSRLVLWEYAFDNFKTSPVFGIGYHTFHHLNPLGKDTHNYFVKVLAEQGLIGFTFLALIFWRAFAGSRRLYRMVEDPFWKGLALGTAGCVAALFMGSMFGDRFSHYPLITYFWVYLALVQRGLLITESGGGTERAAMEALPGHGRRAGAAS